MSHRRSRRYASASRILIPNRDDAAADFSRVTFNADPIARLQASLDSPSQTARRQDAALREQLARAAAVDAALEAARRAQDAQDEIEEEEQNAVQAEARRVQEAALEAVALEAAEDNDVL